MIQPATPLHIVGVDASLTASGIAWPDRTTATLGMAGLTAPSRTIAQRVAGLDVLADQLCAQITGRGSLFDQVRPDLVLLELLPTSGTKVNSERCYVWWKLVSLLTLKGVPVMDVPPTSLKLFMTGMGTANKREMVAAVRRELPAWEIRKTSKAGKVLTTDDDNKADAAALMALGCHLMGTPLLEDTAFRRRALEKLTLPPGVRP